MTAIRLLTFDLDDTLWDLRPVLLRAEQITFEWLQQHAPAVSAKFTADELRDMRLQLARIDPTLRHRVTELRLRGMRAALLLAGYTESESMQLAQQAFEVFVHARHEVSFFESALEVLTQLHKDFVLAAITNGNASPARLGLNHLFAFTINAEQLARPKPHADPFHAALTRAQCAPAQAIHIGDHIEHDVRGAMQVGMHTIWVNRSDAVYPDDQQPDATVRHLTELPDAVRLITEKLQTGLGGT